ncbi:MAG: flagellar hook assembly protein FlgD [Deltaproteobacteria bacterium]|nr:flagellar hook assembly protein FlgD [Deltaproteobacteria bacterium]
MSDVGGIGGTSLGKGDFMKLLVTQLQYQDPLNPMDNTEFIAQLAQFSTLEGITNMEKGIETMSNYMLSMNNYNLTGIIGRDIKAYGNIVSLDGSGGREMGYYLNGNAAKVTTTIYNENGDAVRTIEEGDRLAGKNAILWDGKNSNGSLLPAGKYTFTISAAAQDGSKIGADTILSGLVDGIVYEKGTPYLMVDGIKISMNSVLEVLN